MYVVIIFKIQIKIYNHKLFDTINVNYKKKKNISITSYTSIIKLNL
jgi:hypothetical protein